jgi:hypothetical protein
MGTKPKPDRALIQHSVEAAMRALPLPEEYPPPNEIRELIISSFAEKYADMAFAPMPPGGAKKEIDSELSKIKKQATELLEDLERLNPLAFKAIDLALEEGDHPPAKLITLTAMLAPPSRTLKGIMERLETLVDAAGRARAPHTAKSRRGRDQKKDALEIAKAAARDFNCLTREPPDQSKNKNRFPVFLEAIFKALGRPDDSAESFAKKACKWWASDCTREDAAEFERLWASPPPNLDAKEGSYIADE